MCSVFSSNRFSALLQAIWSHVEYGLNDCRIELDQSEGGKFLTGEKNTTHILRVPINKEISIVIWCISRLTHTPTARITKKKRNQIMRWFFDINRYNDEESDIIGLTYKVNDINKTTKYSFQTKKKHTKHSLSFLNGKNMKCARKLIWNGKRRRNRPTVSNACIAHSFKPNEYIFDTNVCIRFCDWFQFSTYFRIRTRFFVCNF